MLGWVFAHVPIAEEVIVRLNLMAALLCAAGVSTFSFLLRRILVLSVAKNGESALGVTVASSAGSIMLAFSETYWSQALGIEVYSLHVLLTGIIMLAFLRANFPQEREVRSEGRWYLFAFVVGLSFANHMTTILLAPGLLYLYFVKQGGAPSSWKRLLRMIFPLAAGLSAYAYLPIRASASPYLNWGDTISAERFWWHFTGKQYRVWIFSSTEAAGRQFSYFTQSLPPEFAYVGLVIAAAGLVMVWRTNRRLAIALMLLFATCVLYSINYDIHDIDSYFLLAYMSTALCAGAGLYGVFRRLSVMGRRGPAGASVVVLCLGIAPLVMHYRHADRSDDHLVDDYTANMFSSFAQNAVVLSYQWDYWVSASYYHQMIRKIRPDVAVIDKELLRRSWYLRELETRLPWLVAGSREEVDAFLKEVAKFERDLPYNGAVIESRYAAMIGSFIRKSMELRPVYVTPEIEPAYTSGYERVPEGLAFRLLSSPGFVATPRPQFYYRPTPGTGRWESVLRRLYSDALASRGEYYLSAGKDTMEAQKSVEMSLTFDPSSPRALRLLRHFRVTN